MNVVDKDIKDTFRYIINNDKNCGCGRIYQSSNEDIEDLYSSIDFNDKKVLSVLASGDQSFMARLKGASKVDLFDINKLTLYYYYLRVWTMKYFHTFYPEPYLCVDFIKALLFHVKPKSEKEERCFEYWKKIIQSIDEKLLMSLFFSKCTIIQLDDRKIDKLNSLLHNEEPKFYNADISKEIDICDKYDIVITSNIVDWLNADYCDLSEYKKNISKLLKPKGIVLSSNLSNDKIIPYEKRLFDEDFYYHELSGVDSFNSSPGYMFVKK